MRNTKCSLTGGFGSNFIRNTSYSRILLAQSFIRPFNINMSNNNRSGELVIRNPFDLEPEGVVLGESTSTPKASTSRDQGWNSKDKHINEPAENLTGISLIDEYFA